MPSTSVLDAMSRVNRTTPSDAVGPGRNGRNRKKRTEQPDARDDGIERDHPSHACADLVGGVGQGPDAVRADRPDVPLLGERWHEPSGGRIGGEQ